MAEATSELDLISQEISGIEIGDIRNIYRYLTEIFPDADPAYFEQKSFEFSSNREGLDFFVERLAKFKVIRGLMVKFVIRHLEY